MRKVMVFDDLDYDEPADETLPYAFDGEAYVIDLSAANAKAFREALAPFVAVSQRLGKHKITDRKPPSGPRAASRPARGPAGSPVSPAAVNPEWYRTEPGESKAVAAKKQAYRRRVRTWATDHGGYDIGQRGVISREVYRAYVEWCAENNVVCGPETVGL